VEGDAVEDTVGVMKKGRTVCTLRVALAVESNGAWEGTFVVVRLGVFSFTFAVMVAVTVALTGCNNGCIDCHNGGSI